MGEDDRSRLARALTTTSGSKPAIADGLIVAFTFVVPTLVGLVVDEPQPALIVAAVATMVVAAAPARLPIGRRVVVMLVASFVASIVMCCGALVAPNAVAAASVLTIVTLAGGIATAFGGSGLVAGSLAGPIALMVLSLTSSTLGEAAALAVAAMIGGIWAIAVGATWTLIRNRNAASDALRAVSDLVAEMAEALRGSIAGDRDADASFDRLRTDSARIVTEAVMATGRVDRRRLARYATIAVALIETRTRPPAGADLKPATALHDLATYLRASPEAEPSHALVTALRWSGLGNIADAVDLDPADPLAIDGSMWDPPPFVHHLASICRWHSMTFRHALRLAVTTGLALLVARLGDIPDGSWIPLTVLVVMRAEATVTYERLIQRIAGTIVGALVGGLLLTLIGGRPYLLALTAACLVVVMIATMPLNYLYWTMSITPFVLLALSIAAPESWTDVGWRVVHTVAGGLLAVVATGLLWPTRDESHLASLIADSVDALATELDRAHQAPGRAVLKPHFDSIAAGSDAKSAVAMRRNDPGADRPTVERLAAVERAARDVRDHVRAYANSPGDRSSAQDHTVERLRTMARRVRSGSSTDPVPPPSDVETPAGMFMVESVVNDLELVVG